MRTLLGFGILRTLRSDVRGKTMCQYPHTLYPTREAAREALDAKNHAAGHQFDYQLVEVWFGDGVQS